MVAYVEISLIRFGNEEEKEVRGRRTRRRNEKDDEREKEVW